MESILTVFCCVVFPFHDSISSCLHVHGNVPKCYPRMLWVVFISLLCMKNKIHIGLKGDKRSNNSRQTIENTHWDNCPVGFCFERKQEVLFKMWMSLANFMFLLPYNKVLL